MLCENFNLFGAAGSRKLRYYVATTKRKSTYSVCILCSCFTETRNWALWKDLKDEWTEILLCAHLIARCTNRACLYDADGLLKVLFSAVAWNNALRSEKLLQWRAFMNGFFAPFIEDGAFELILRITKRSMWHHKFLMFALPFIVLARGDVVLDRRKYLLPMLLPSAWASKTLTKLKFSPKDQKTDWRLCHCISQSGVDRLRLQNSKNVFFGETTGWVMKWRECAPLREGYWTAAPKFTTLQSAYCASI